MENKAHIFGFDPPTQIQYCNNKIGFCTDVWNHPSKWMWNIILIELINESYQIPNSIAIKYVACSVSL